MPEMNQAQVGADTPDELEREQMLHDARRLEAEAAAESDPDEREHILRTVRALRRDARG
ncbi:hypothetical protein [Tranquillimonas alkanivorans]|uniref:Uncharacterized protein n=1 Tax=Tranquillimonas alkanivorans TaxID=441119 RepID=A0A1I5TVT6_9RHOB|nr:hypothetical protein [Tranquillimonas alkanivorans]SFP86717.1 hypothetical protein SAMN04488047_11535 [Tranquillimonas alkanivorans]